MKPRTELDLDFDYKDNPDFTKHVVKSLVATSLISVSMVIGVMAAIVHADKIDYVFSRVLFKLFQ
jgi:hypothetical protein